jgi:hypothetical protein
MDVLIVIGGIVSIVGIFFLSTFSKEVLELINKQMTLRLLNSPGTQFQDLLDKKATDEAVYLTHLKGQKARILEMMAEDAWEEERGLVTQIADTMLPALIREKVDLQASAKHSDAAKETIKQVEGKIMAWQVFLDETERALRQRLTSDEELVSPQALLQQIRETASGFDTAENEIATAHTEAIVKPSTGMSSAQRAAIPQKQPT